MPRRDKVAEAAVVVSADTEKFERQVATDLQDESARAGKRAGRSFSEGFGEGATQAEAGTEKVREGMEDVHEESKKTEESVGSVDERVSELGEDASIAGEGLLGMAQILATKLSTGAAKAATKVTFLATEGLENVGSATERAGTELREASEDMEHFGVVANVTGRTLESVGGTVETVARKINNMKKAAIAAGVAGLAESTRRADNFEQSFNKVLSVLPEGTARAGRLRAELNEMAAQTRQSAKAANNTLFKVLTRMPRLAQDTEKALDVVRVGLEAQSTGFVDATDAVAAYEAVLQGFQMEASDAAEISNLLFLAQRRAGVEFSSIANSVGDVASTTNALNGEFEDLLAIYSTLVPTGQSVSQVNTQIRSVMQGIINPTEEARKAQEELGLELSAQKVRAQGLNEVILEVIEATKGQPELISRLFGRQEAITFLTTLAQRTDKLEGEMGEFADASGEADKVVDQMGDSIGASLSDIGTDLAAIARTIGGVFQPAVEGFFDAIAVGTEILRTMNDEFFRWLRGVQNLEGPVEIPFLSDEQVESFSAQRLEFVRRAQRELGIISEERFRELEAQYGEAGRRAGKAFREGLSDEARAFEAMEGVAPALRRERIERLRDPNITQGRQPPEIERPELPADPEIVAERAREIQRLGELRAQMARMAGEEESQVQHILTQNQARLNEFVRTQIERLRNYGVAEEKLANIASFWEEIGVSTDEVRAVTEDTASSIEQRMAESAENAEESFREHVERGLEIELPSLDLGEDLRLTEFERKVRTARRRLEELSNSGELTFENVQEVLRDTGLSLEELRQQGEGALSGLIAAVIRWKREQEEAEEDTDDLVETLSKIAAVADGIIQAADAMGELDSETRRALQAMRGLVQAGIQFASGNIAAGAAQALGSIGGLISVALGPSEREKVIRENTAALRELRTDIDSLRNAISGTPGNLLAVSDRLDSLVAQIPENFGPLPESALPEDRFFGTEDEDLFGEPEATGGEVEAFLDELGISFSELERLAEQTGVSIENLTKAIEEGEAPADAVRQELIDLNEAMKEMEIERIFEGWQGAMNRLEDRFELFDVEDPVEKLEMIREELLKFTDLPEQMRSRVAGFDLSTAAGRRRLQTWIQEQWQRLVSGDLSAAELGGLTPEQFRQQLRRLESLADRAAEEGGGATTSFQVSRQITEVTANRLTATMTTISVLARQRNRILTGIADELGATIPRSVRPPDRPAPRLGGGGGGGSSTVVEIGEGAVQIAADGRLTREDGREAGRGFVEIIDRRLGGFAADRERRNSVENRGGRA